MIRHLLIGMMLSSSMLGYSQQKEFSVEFERESLESVLELVSRSTGFYFAYNSAVIDTTSRFTMKAENVTLDEFLNRLLVGTGLEHQVLADQVVIRQAPVIRMGSKRTFFSISGRVVDSLNRQPIPGANVFLSGTNIGSVTDLDGYYLIDRIPIGTYEVIFSHLSFDMLTRKVSGSRQGMQTINAELPQKTMVLDTVQVVSRRLIGPDERKRFIRIFENEFLGRSSIAEKCTLLNPEVLDFIYEGSIDKLEVFALEPVKIENRFLGYRITYFFEKFTKIGDVLDFYGKARFDDLRPANRRQKRSWERNRISVYFGSFLHFRRSLVEKNLRKNDFRIGLIETQKLTEVAKLPSKSVDIDQILKEDNGSFSLDFEGFLEVVYRRKADEMYKRQFYESPDERFQLSLLKLKGSALKLKSNGGMEFPGLETYGYWYWERLGDLLPENYDPEMDEIEL